MDTPTYNQNRVYGPENPEQHNHKFYIERLGKDYYKFVDTEKGISKIVFTKWSILENKGDIVYMEARQTMTHDSKPISIDLENTTNNGIENGIYHFKYPFNEICIAGKIYDTLQETMVALYNELINPLTHHKHPIEDIIGLDKEIEKLPTLQQFRTEIFEPHISIADCCPESSPVEYIHQKGTAKYLGNFVIIDLFMQVKLQKLFDAGYGKQKITIGGFPKCYSKHMGYCLTNHERTSIICTVNNDKPLQDFSLNNLDNRHVTYDEFKNDENLTVIATMIYQIF